MKLNTLGSRQSIRRNIYSPLTKYIFISSWVLITKIQEKFEQIQLIIYFVTEHMPNLYFQNLEAKNSDEKYRYSCIQLIKGKFKVRQGYCLKFKE